MILAALLALHLAALPGSISQAELERTLRTVATGSRPEVEQVINRLQYLGSPRPAVVALVQMALGQLNGSQENAVYVLSVLHPPEAQGAFVQLLGSDQGPIRLESCRALGRLKGSPGSARRVAALLADPIPEVRRACAQTLGQWGAAHETAALAKALAHEQDPDAKLAEIDALGTGKGPAAVKALQPALAGSGEAHLAAARALAALGSADGRKALEAALDAVDPATRAHAVELVAGLKPGWTTDALVKRLDDPSADVCIKAAKALHARKDPRGVTALILRAERASPDDKFAFEGALSELQVTQAQRLDVIQKSGGAHKLAQ